VLRLTIREELVGYVKILGSSDHEAGDGIQDHQDYNPGCKRTDFGLFIFIVTTYF